MGCSHANCWIVSPSCSCLQFVDVFLAQDDGMVAESQEEVVVLLDVVEVAELIYARGAYLHTVLLEPLIEYFLALLLHFRLSRRRMACILLFALAVLTKLIQPGCTCWLLLVRISTWSPLCNLWLSGTNLWLTLAPMQWLPRKVCIWKAKSSAVQSDGIVLISPFGVKTKISDAKRLERWHRGSPCARLRVIEDFLDGT